MSIPNPLQQVSAHRRRTLLIAALAVGIVLIAWNVPALDFAMYPLRLFVTFVHESGHGLAALLSGGQFRTLAVMADGSGVATTAGGARALILPAGYLGAALFGAGLFVAANLVRRVRWVSAGLAALLVAFTLLYTPLLSTGFLVGLGFAALLGALAWKANADVNRLVLMALALLVSLNAIFDLTSLVANSGASMGAVRNDAAAFSAEIVPLIPGALWAVCWSGIAILLLVGAIYYGLVRPLRRGG
ncbi:MAG TPA: M50 family metallopeptidase [Candidatus Limnocylindrales bacterium]|nr:M50 family metallopeptidase [Candidatus Limnocylindrales bacterium]